MAEAGNSCAAAAAKDPSKLMVLRSGKKITKPEYIAPRFCGVKRPRIPLTYNLRGNVGNEEFIRPDVHMALKYFNAENFKKGRGPCYKLVKICNSSISGDCFHFNFIARPENASDDENQLFFGEVTRDGFQNPFYCSCCSIIGPPDTVTGLHGCRLACFEHRRLIPIQHPKDGFTKN